MTWDELRVAVGRRFARLATNVVTRFPGLWPVFRGLIGVQFDANRAKRRPTATRSSSQVTGTPA